VTKPLTNQLLQESIHILRFGVTGLAGFLVDAGVLALMVHWIGADPFTGRTVSAPIAIVFTFVCNRYWSFATLNKPSIGSSFASYVSTQGAGFLCNFAVYSLVLLSVSSPIVALAIASAAAMFVNYLGARFLAFRGAD
jgi:putative flippase GtrA